MTKAVSGKALALRDDTVLGRSRGGKRDLRVGEPGLRPYQLTRRLRSNDLHGRHDGESEDCRDERVLDCRGAARVAP
jgi:hypothetical protein